MRDSIFRRGAALFLIVGLASFGCDSVKKWTGDTKPDDAAAKEKAEADRLAAEKKAKEDEERLKQEQAKVEPEKPKPETTEPPVVDENAITDKDKNWPQLAAYNQSQKFFLPILKSYLAKSNLATESKIHVIPNGFDENDFPHFVNFSSVQGCPFIKQHVCNFNASHVFI